MRADEFLVARYLDMEKRCRELEKKLEKSADREEALAEELADYDQLVQILQNHVKEHSYGVEIYFATMRENDIQDLDYVKSYLRIGETDKEES